VDDLRLSLLSLGRYDELIKDLVDQDGDNAYLANNGVDDDGDGFIDEPDEGIDEEDIYSEQRNLRNDDLDSFVEGQGVSIADPHVRQALLDAAAPIDYTEPLNLVTNMGAYDRGVDFVYVDNLDTLTYPRTLPGLLDAYDYVPGDSRIMAGTDDYPTQKLLKNDDADYYIDDPSNADFEWPPGSGNIFPYGFLSSGGSIPDVTTTVYEQAGTVGAVTDFDGCADLVARDLNGDGFVDLENDLILYPGLTGLIPQLLEDIENSPLANDDNDFFLPDGGPEAAGARAGLPGFPSASDLTRENFTFVPGDEVYFDNPERGLRFELDLGDFVLTATGAPDVPIRGTYGANGVRDWDVRVYNDDGDAFFKEGDSVFFEPGTDEVILDVFPPFGIYNFEEITEDVNEDGVFDPPIDIIYHRGATPDEDLPVDGDAYNYPQPVVTSPEPAIPFFADFYYGNGLTAYYSAQNGDVFNYPTGDINETDFRTSYHLLGYALEELDREERDRFQGTLFTNEDMRLITNLRRTFDPTGLNPNSTLIAAASHVFNQTGGELPLYFVYAFDDPAGEAGVPDVIRDPDQIIDSTDEIIFDNLNFGTDTVVDFPDEQLVNSYLVGYATDGLVFNLTPPFVGHVFTDVDFHNILSIWVEYTQSFQGSPLSLLQASLDYVLDLEGINPSWFIYAWDDPAAIAQDGIADVVRNPEELNTSPDKIIYDSLLAGRPLIYDGGDEFIDENGNGVWDGDIVLYPGRNGEIDVENGDPIAALIDEEIRDGSDNDRDGAVDEDCNSVPLIPLIDEDGIDFLDNDGDGLVDEDPFVSEIPIAVKGELIDEEKEDDVDNDCDGMTDEDVDYIPLFRLADEEILDYFIDRPGGRDGFFDFVDVNGNGIFDPQIIVNEVFLIFGRGRELQVSFSGDIPLDEYFVDWDADGAYDSGRGDGIEGNPDEFINVFYDPGERPLLFIDQFAIYPYHTYATAVDNDGDGEIGHDQLVDVNEDGIVDYRDRYLLARPNGRDDDGDGEAGSPRDDQGRALADGLDNDGDGFVDEGIDEGFNEDVGDFAFQWQDDLNGLWTDETLDGLQMWISDGQDQENLFETNLDLTFNNLDLENIVSDGYGPLFRSYQSQPHTHVGFVWRDMPPEDPLAPRDITQAGNTWFLAMRTGGWDTNNNAPGPNFGDNWAVGLLPGGVTLGRVGHAVAGYGAPDIDFEPPLNISVLPPEMRSLVLSGGGFNAYIGNWTRGLNLSQGKPQDGLISKPVYALAFLDGITGFKAGPFSTLSQFGDHPLYPEVFSYPYAIDPESGFDRADEGGGFWYPPYADATNSYHPLIGLNLCDAVGAPHGTTNDQPQSETLEWIRVNVETEDLEGRGVFLPNDLNAIAEDFTSGLNLFRDDRTTYQFDEDNDGAVDEDPYDGVDNDGDLLVDEDGGGSADGDFDGESHSSSFFFNRFTDNTTENAIPLAAVEWDPDPNDPVVRAGAHYVVLTPRVSVALPYDDGLPYNRGWVQITDPVRFIPANEFIPINRGWDFFVVFRTSETIDYHDAFRCWVRDGDVGFRNGRTVVGTWANVDPVSANVPTALEDLAPDPIGGDQTTPIQAGSDLLVLGFDMHDANQTFQGIPSKLAGVRVWIDDVNENGAPDTTGDFNITDLAPLLPPNKAWVVINRNTGAVRPSPYRFGETLGPDERLGSINAVALYRDAADGDNPGQFDDPFDPGIEIADTPVLLSGDEEFNFIMGSTYNVYMVLDPPSYDIDIFPDLPPDLDFSPVDPFDPDPLEPLPPDNETPEHIGNDYYVVIRTSETISFGDEFRVSVGVRGINGIGGFTSFLFHPPLLNSGRHPFPVTQPFSLSTSFETITATRILRNPVITHTTLTDLVGPMNRQDASSPPFPVFGINVFDTQGGSETLTSVRVEVTALEPFDPLLELNPLARDRTSGIALYSDGRAVSRQGRVLIYADGPTTGDPADGGDIANSAALSLGHSTTLVNGGTVSDQQERLDTFLAELASQPRYDLVIVCQEFTDFPLRALGAIANYVRDGGHLIFFTVDLDASAANALWTLMGVRFNQDLGDVQPTINWPDLTHPVASRPNVMSTFFPVAEPGVDNGDYVTSFGGFTTVAVGNVTDPATGLVVAADDGSTVFNGFAPIQFLASQMSSMMQNEIQYILRQNDDGVFNPDLDQALEIIGLQYLLNYFADNPGPDGVFGRNPVTLVNDDDPRQRIGRFDEGIDEVFLDVGRGGGTIPGYVDPHDTLVDDGDNNRRDVPMGLPLYPLLRQSDVNLAGDDIAAQYSVFLSLVAPQQIPPDDEAASGSRGPDFYVVARTSPLIDFRDKYRFRIARNAVTFSSGQSLGNADIVSHVVDTNVPTYLVDSTEAFGAVIGYSTDTVAPIAIHMVNSTPDIVRLRSIFLVFESIDDYDFSPSDLSQLLTALDPQGRFLGGVGLFRDDLTPEADGIDNDRDGLTDEEMRNFVDDDGDGVIDEADWADDDPAGVPGVFDFDPITGIAIDDFVPLAQAQLVSLEANPFTRFGVELTVARDAVDPVGRYLGEVPHGTEFIEGPFAEADFFVVVRPSATAIAGDDFRLRIEPGRIQFRDGAYPSGESVITGAVSMEMSVPPSFMFIRPPAISEVTIFSGSSSIVWTDDDPDDNASISLYYVFEDEYLAGGPIETPADGRLNLIGDATGIPEDPDGFGFDEYLWDVANDRIRAGDPLRIVAIVEDGFNVPLIVVSSLVVVENEEPTIDVIEPATGEQQVFSTFDIAWEASDEDNSALISLYLVAEATRSVIEAQLEARGVEFLPGSDIGTDFVVLATEIPEDTGVGVFRVDVSALIAEERVALGERYYVLGVITDLVQRVVSPPPFKRVMIPAYHDFSDGIVVPVFLPTVRIVEPSVPISVNGEIFISFVGTLPNGATSDAQVELYLSLGNFGFGNDEQIEGGLDTLPPVPEMIFLKLIPVSSLVFDPARPTVYSGSATIQIVNLDPDAGIVEFEPWVPLGEDAYAFAQVVERPSTGGIVKNGNFSAGRFRFNEHFIRVLEPSAEIPAATAIATFEVAYAAISRIPGGASPTVSLFRDLDQAGLNGQPFQDPSGTSSLALRLPASGAVARATFEWDLREEPLATLFVYAVLNDSADDFGEEFHDYSDGPLRIGKEVEVRSGTAAYILTGRGGLYFSDGSLPKMLPPEYGMDIVRSVEAAFARRGYYLLTGDGAIHSVGDAPPLAAPMFDTDAAIDLEILPWMEPAGYVLDRFGGVHPVGGAPFRGDTDFGFDFARDMEVMPSGRGYVILDAFGGLHCFGEAALPPVSLPGFDEAVDIELTSTGKGYYILTRSGMVVAGGEAKPHGYELLEGGEARDLTVVGGGTGYLVMDAYGEIRGYGEAAGTYVPARLEKPEAQDLEKVMAILFVNVTALDDRVESTADPAVSVRSDGRGPWVLWMERGLMGRDIMMYDAAVDGATPLDQSAGDQTQPALDGDHAVWTSSVTGNRDVFYKNLASDLSLPVNLTGAMAGGVEPQEQSDICGHWVVYAGFDPVGEDFDIYLLDIQPLLDGFGVESLAPPVLLTNASVDPSNADQSAPRVFAAEEGGLETVYVVWEHLGLNGLDVYLYRDVVGDEVPGQVGLLAGGPGNQSEPDIHAREIGFTNQVVRGTFEPWAVYTENTGGDLNLFVVRFVEGLPRMALPSDPANPTVPIDPNQQRGGTVSGERITWIDQRNGFDALYMFDFLVRTPSGDLSNPNGEIRFTAGNLVIPSAANDGPWVVYLQQSGDGFALNLSEISIDVIGPAAP